MRVEEPTSYYTYDFLFDLFFSLLQSIAGRGWKPFKYKRSDARLWRATKLNQIRKRVRHRRGVWRLLVLAGFEVVVGGREGVRTNRLLFDCCFCPARAATCTALYVQCLCACLHACVCRE